MAACHRCGTAFATFGTVSRQESCLKCHSYLRACLNCAQYDPRSKNDCVEPEAEPVSDKENATFCEFFSVNNRVGGGGGSAKPAPAVDPFEALFKKS